MRLARPQLHLRRRRRRMMQAARELNVLAISLCERFERKIETGQEFAAADDAMLAGELLRISKDLGT